MPKSDTYVTVREAARLLHVNRARVYQLVEAGKTPRTEEGSRSLTDLPGRCGGEAACGRGGRRPMIKTPNAGSTARGGILGRRKRVLPEPPLFVTLWQGGQLVRMSSLRSPKVHPWGYPS
jgi:excisionase family DNA binding protein